MGFGRLLVPLLDVLVLLFLGVVLGLGVRLGSRRGGFDLGLRRLDLFEESGTVVFDRLVGGLVSLRFGLLGLGGFVLAADKLLDQRERRPVGVDRLVHLLEQVGLLPARARRSGARGLVRRELGHHRLFGLDARLGLDRCRFLDGLAVPADRRANRLARLGLGLRGRFDRSRDGLELGGRLERLGLCLGLVVGRLRIGCRRDGLGLLRCLGRLLGDHRLLRLRRNRLGHRLHLGRLRFDRLFSLRDRLGGLRLLGRSRRRDGLDDVRYRLVGGLFVGGPLVRHGCDGRVGASLAVGFRRGFSQIAASGVFGCAARGSPADDARSVTVTLLFGGVMAGRDRAGPLGDLALEANVLGVGESGFRSQLARQHVALQGVPMTFARNERRGFLRGHAFVPVKNGRKILLQLRIPERTGRVPAQPGEPDRGGQDQDADQGADRRMDHARRRGADGLPDHSAAAGDEGAGDDGRAEREAGDAREPATDLELLAGQEQHRADTRGAEAQGQARQRAEEAGPGQRHGRRAARVVRRDVGNEGHEREHGEEGRSPEQHEASTVEAPVEVLLPLTHR